MKRFAYTLLKEWKNSPSRQPLILEGARQVGKTWLLKYFGKNEFENFVYINCDNNPVLDDIFIDYDINRIIRNLSAFSNINIQPQTTLIIFDEIFVKSFISIRSPFTRFHSSILQGCSIQLTASLRCPYAGITPLQLAAS